MYNTVIPHPLARHHLRVHMSVTLALAHHPPDTAAHSTVRARPAGLALRWQAWQGDTREISRLIDDNIRGVQGQLGAARHRLEEGGMDSGFLHGIFEGGNSDGNGNGGQVAAVAQVPQQAAGDVGDDALPMLPSPVAAVGPPVNGSKRGAPGPLVSGFYPNPNHNPNSERAYTPTLTMSGGTACAQACRVFVVRREEE